jgi:aryl-alcohol dehydrogenase-like predicted oxidoreductase
VSLLAYSPLAGGALSGKYLTRDAPKEARFNLFPGCAEGGDGGVKEGAPRVAPEAALQQGHGVLFACWLRAPHGRLR